MLPAPVNRLNDRGRLAQAIGTYNSAAILQHVDEAYLQAQRISQKQKWAVAIAKVAGFSGAGRLASTGRMSFWAGSSQPTELTHPRRSAHGPVPWFGRLQWPVVARLHQFDNPHHTLFCERGVRDELLRALGLPTMLKRSREVR